TGSSQSASVPRDLANSKHGANRSSLNVCGSFSLGGALFPKHSASFVPKPCRRCVGVSCGPRCVLSRVCLCKQPPLQLHSLQRIIHQTHKRAAEDVHPETGPSASHDWIGPPNRLSNMRPIVYRAPDRETQLEKRLRTLRQETEDWNHDFWTKQNVTFSQVHSLTALPKSKLELELCN
uniref:Apoptogenic 1, mitochondrial n=1 Tax=Neogobius melanostomus TaxID=47308 RepID=A0A8C6SPI2_9GOBI